MNSSYSENQLLTNYPDGIENHYWNSSRNRILLNIIKNNSLSDKKILEIGCGRGVVVDYLNKQKIKCFGADLAEGTAIADNKNVYLNTNAFELEQKFRDSIEVIMLLDVIEHIEAPEKFLNVISNSFPNACKYIIAVPARQEIWSNYDEFYGHFRRYSKKRLKQDVTSINAKVEGIHYLYHALFYPALLLKTLNINRNVYLQAPRGLLQKNLHKMISLYFYLEYKLKLSNIIGSSIVGIFSVKK